MTIAGPVAPSGEAARDRYRAEAVIRGVISVSRDTLCYDRDRDFAEAHFPNSYVNPKSREQMASEVLGHVVTLRVWQRIAILRGMDLLIGASSLRWVQAYLHAKVSDEKQTWGRSFDAVKSALAGENQGLLQAVLASEDSNQERARCDLP